MRRLYLSLLVLIGMYVAANGATTRPLFTTQGHSIDDEGQVTIGVQTDSKLAMSFTLPPSVGSLESADSPYLSEGRFETAEQGTVPMITRWVIVPPRADVTAVVRRQTGDWINSRTGATSVMSAELTQNGLEPMYPAKAVYVGKPMVMRGVRMVPLTVFPSQINTKNNELFQSRDLDIDLIFTDGSRDNIVTGPQPPMTPEFARTLKSIAINAPDEPLPTRDAWGDTRGRMLIIRSNTADATARSYINDFVQWKRKLGWTVDVQTHNPAANHDHNNVKQKIKAAYANGLDYVVLIGHHPLKDDKLLPQDPFYLPSHPEITVVGGDSVTVYSDNLYGCMDQDPIPDVAIGRISATNNVQLAGVIARTIRYEREPYLEAGNDWHRRALLTTEWKDGGRSSVESRSLMQWQATRLTEMGYQDVRLVQDKENQEAVIEAVTPTLNEGVSVALADGWLLGAVRPGDPTEVLAATGRRNPFVVAISQYNEISTMTNFFHTTTAADPKGPVAVMGSWYKGGYSDWFRPVLASTVNAMRYNNITTPGNLWLISQATLGSYLNLPNEDENQRALNNARIRWMMGASYLLGDPSVNIYTATPSGFRVTGPEVFELYDNDVWFTVKDAAQEPVKDAMVVIRTMKNDTTETRKLVGYTDASGYVQFAVPDSGLTSDMGQLEVLIRKPNYAPYQVNIPILPINASTPKMTLESIAIEDDNSRLDKGDSSRLRVTVKNRGRVGGTAYAVICSVYCDHPMVKIHNPVTDMGNVLRNNTRATGDSLMITVDPQTKGKTPIFIYVQTRDRDDRKWLAVAELTTFGPMAEIYDYKVTNFVGDPTLSVGLWPIVRNVGNSYIGSLVCTLSSDDPYVKVTQPIRRYRRMNEGETSTPNDSFRVRFNTGVVPSSEVMFKLRAVAEDALELFDTTLTFTIPVKSIQQQQPFQPVKEGYICYETDDAGFNAAPAYNWREINPYIDGHVLKGTKLDQNDPVNDPNWDANSLVKLPFPFRYYGQEFDTITVSFNGWLAMGKEALGFVSPENTPIPGTTSPDAQIAPYWDDFVNTSPRFNGVYAGYLENDGLFVIQWSEVSLIKRMVAGGQGQPDKPEYEQYSFQVLLADPAIYSTPNGDGEIIFQYKKVELLPGYSPSGIPQYSTIGIRTLDGSSGIQYEYWGKYHPNATPLRNEFAIKFSSAPHYGQGSIQYGVVRAHDHLPIIGAKVSHPSLPEGIETNEEGFFYFDKIRSRTYKQVKVTAPGYNPAYLDMEVLPDSVQLIWDLVLLFTPEMAWSPNKYALDKLVVAPDTMLGNQGVLVRNRGDGALNYSVLTSYADFTLPTFKQVDSISNIEPFIPRGLTFDPIANKYYLVGRQVADNAEQSIFRLSANGAVETKWVIPKVGGELFNLVNIAWDGTHFWGTGTDNKKAWQVIRFTDGSAAASQLVDAIPTPFNQAGTGTNLCIAYDPTVDEVWLVDENTDIVRMNRDGDISKSVRIGSPDRMPNIHGIAFNPWDSKGMQMYAIDGWMEEGKPAFRLIRADVETNAWEVASGQLAGSALQDGDTALRFGPALVYTPGGADIRLAMTEAIKAQGGAETKVIRIYEAGPNTSFIENGLIDHRNGSVNPNGTVPALFNISSKGWKDGMTADFGIVLVDHLSGNTIQIPASLRIDAETGIADQGLQPLTFDLKAVYPNPFNAVTRVVFSADRVRNTKLIVYDSQGRLVGKLFDGSATAGIHTIHWNAMDMASGIYFLRLESEGTVRTMKVALVK